MAVTKLKKVKKIAGVQKKIKEEIDVILPEEVSEISNRIGDFTWLIYGERKIGKTTLFRHFKNTLFLMFDPPQKGLAIRQLHIPNWKFFLKTIKKLEERLKKEPNYCNMIIIDTGFMCYEKCFNYVCDREGVTDPNDRGWSIVWKKILREFMEAHERITAMGIPFGATAHSEIKEIKKGGIKIDKLTTQLGAQATKYYNGFVDIIAYYEYDNRGGRRLNIRGNAALEVGKRVENHFMYTDGTPVESIPMGNSSKEAYQNLQLAFYNKLTKEVLARKKTAVKKK